MLPLKVLSEAEAVQELRDMIDGFDIDDLAHMCSELTHYEGLRVVVRLEGVDSAAWVDGQCLGNQQETQGDCGMTFEDWRATRHQATMGLERDILEDNFGYVPADWLTVYVYDGAGVLCSLKNGQHFTHIGRSEYTGTLDAVERRLWDEHVKHDPWVHAEGRG